MIVLGSYRYRDLEKHVADFQSQGIPGKVCAAGLCAYLLVHFISRFELAIGFDYPDDNEGVAIASKAYPRFFKLHELLISQLSCPKVQIELDRLYEHPLEVERFRANSYIQVANLWAADWALAFYCLATPHDEAVGSNWTDNRPIPPFDAIENEWSDLLGLYGIKMETADPKRVVEILRLGIQKEVNRFAPEPPNGSADQRYTEITLPSLYRENGKASGRPLTAQYLEKSVWNLRGDTLTKNFGEGKRLTKRVKCDRGFAYHYQEVFALREYQTSQLDTERSLSIDASEIEARAKEVREKALRMKRQS